MRIDDQKLLCNCVYKLVQVVHTTIHKGKKISFHIFCEETENWRSFSFKLRKFKHRGVWLYRLCQHDSNITNELLASKSTATKTLEQEIRQSNLKNQNSPDDHTSEPCQSTIDLAVHSTEIFNTKDPGAMPWQVADHDKQLILKYGLNNETKLKEMVTSLPKDGWRSYISSLFTP